MTVVKNDKVYFVKISLFDDKTLLFLPLKLCAADVDYKVSAHQCQLPCIRCPFTDTRTFVFRNARQVRIFLKFTKNCDALFTSPFNNLIARLKNLIYKMMLPKVEKQFVM